MIGEGWTGLIYFLGNVVHPVWIQDEIETSFHLFLSQLVQRHMSSYSDWRGLKWVLIWYSSTGSAYKCGRTARCHIFLVSYFLSNWRSFEACELVVNMDLMLVQSVCLWHKRVKLRLSELTRLFKDWSNFEQPPSPLKSCSLLQFENVTDSLSRNRF